MKKTFYGTNVKYELDFKYYKYLDLCILQYPQMSIITFKFL